jgi:hypothetical protein
MQIYAYLVSKMPIEGSFNKILKIQKFQKPSKKTPKSPPNIPKSPLKMTAGPSKSQKSTYKTPIPTIKHSNSLINTPHPPCHNLLLPVPPPVAFKHKHPVSAGAFGQLPGGWALITGEIRGN